VKDSTYLGIGRRTKPRREHLTVIVQQQPE